MPFVNDPQFADLSPVGKGAAMLVAARTRCGEAFAWVPGGDADALVAFVGDELVAVAGVVYQRQGDGTLAPFDAMLKAPLVVVKPPAGEVIWLTSAEFKSQWAQVLVDAAPKAVEKYYKQPDQDVSDEATEAEVLAVAHEVLESPAPKRKPGRPPKPKE